MSKGRCRDCGKEQGVELRDWSHASKPRCAACGGLLDRIGARLPYARTPPGNLVRASRFTPHPDKKPPTNVPAPVKRKKEKKRKCADCKGPRVIGQQYCDKCRPKHVQLPSEKTLQRRAQDKAYQKQRKQFPGGSACQRCGQMTNNIRCIYADYWVCPVCEILHKKLARCAEQGVRVPVTSRRKIPAPSR